MLRILKDYPEISLKTENLEGKIDFKRILGRSAAVHIEVGSGKGTFLLNQSKAEPEINFLGIEWANKYYRHAVDRMGRWEIKNVRIVRADAAASGASYQVRSKPASCCCCVAGPGRAASQRRRTGIRGGIAGTGDPY